MASAEAFLVLSYQPRAWFMPLAAQFPRGFLWPPSVIFQVPEEELLAVIPRSPSCCNWKAHENLQSSELMAALEAASWDFLPSCQRFLSWPVAGEGCTRKFWAGLLLASLKIKGLESRQCHSIVENTGPLGTRKQSVLPN